MMKDAGDISGIGWVGLFMLFMRIYSTSSLQLRFYNEHLIFEFCKVYFFNI